MEHETVTIGGRQYALGPIMPPEVPPVHVGWYLRCFDPADQNNWRIMSPDYWDGERWMLCDSTGHVIASSRPNRYWRGLAEPCGREIVPPPNCASQRVGPEADTQDQDEDEIEVLDVLDGDEFTFRRALAVGAIVAVVALAIALLGGWL